MRFTLRQLEYFVAAGETLSITRASEQTAISQPSISTAISQLEKELGVQLFVRHHAQGLSLTPAGRRLLREAKALLAQAEGLYHLADEMSGQLRGSLTVGCFVTLAPMILPELSHSFAAACPGAEIRSEEAHQETLLERLRRAEIDVAITYDLQIPSDIAFRPLVSLPPHALVGESHRLAGRGEVALAELAPDPLVLLDLPISREYFLSMFLREGLEPVIAARSAHLEVVRTMVANGQGYSLANIRPRSDQAMDGRRLVRLPLTGDFPPMAIGIATAAQIGKSKLLQAFEAHCAARITSSHVPGMIAPAEEA